MSNTDNIILEKLCSTIFKQTLVSWFVLNRSGTITQWGGNLPELNIPVPEPKSHISDVLVFMEGLLPLKGTNTMEFSCIKMDPDICLDALLFIAPKGYGLILWDAAQKETLLTQTQQQCNELSLLIEEQKNRIIKSRDRTVQPGDLTFLEDLFHALNYAVLEMDESGHFVLLGTPPMWVTQIPQSSRLLSGQVYEEDVFSFLGNFIQEAKTRWAKNPNETFKSGLWIEKDHTGQEFLFEATGVSVHGKKLLMIANDYCDPAEKQSIIQKGRNLALHYHDLKRSEKELKNMHDELEVRVKERTKDLEQANIKLADELRQREKIEKEGKEIVEQLRQARKMEAIGTLAGGIAHDFNNILSAIMGYTELSIIEADEHATLKPMLEKILHASERAKDLVHQILTFSRQTEHEKRPLQLNLVVKEALQLLRASLPAFIDIKKDLDCNAYILADPSQIHQVVMNLCTNAWHAMETDGGTLSVSIRETTIDALDSAGLSEADEGPYVVLTIEDTGRGIPPDMLDRIFDPYFTTKNIHKGTGLGLSVVHGIVTGSGGRITVNSKEEEGSEFKVLWPSFACSEPVLKKTKTMSRGNNEHILFVDDEIFQTQMAEQMLTSLGYRVTACNDGIEALDLILNPKNTFDIVITDMIMPAMTGKVLAEKILDHRPGMPIILCSGHSEDMNPDIAREAGISHYLIKPVSMQALSHTIKAALEKNRE